ncbi:MAG: hypothetical protein QXP44_03205, partial [Candidatus Bathyarchaeia archaeon]
MDLSYKPAETDLVCTFYVEPEGISLKEAAGGVGGCGFRFRSLPDYGTTLARWW